MPSKSASQAKFMRAIAHSPAFAKKVGVKQSVGKDFEMADKKMKKFGDGGKAAYPIRIDLDKTKRDTAARDKARPQNLPARAITQRDLDRHARIQGEEAKGEAAVMKRAKGGKVLKRVKVAKKTMRKGSGLADLMGRALAARSAGAGTPPMAPPTGPDMGAGAPPMGMPGMKKGGKTKKYAKGGKVPKRYAGAGAVMPAMLNRSTPPASRMAPRTAPTSAPATLNKYAPPAPMAPASAPPSVTAMPTPPPMGMPGLPTPAMGIPGMKKGGKAKAKSFAATKFGAAMMKKSGDTKGRAMKKFAKGGSIDGIAQRGKTKTKKVTMKNGGMC